MSGAQAGSISSRADVAATIAERMSKIAAPDSRFGRDFTQFIPSFDGADEAADRLMATREARGARRVLVTPDNAVAAVRQRLLSRDVDLVVPSYGLHRGFLDLAAREIPGALAPYAGWLDVAEHFGRSLTLDSLAAGGPIDLIVTGASAITRQGFRFGMGDFYLDVEWIILRALGLVRDETPVVAVTHDAQIADAPLDAGPGAVKADVIVTPSAVLKGEASARPRALDESGLPDALLRTETLQDFRRRFSHLSGAHPPERA